MPCLLAILALGFPRLVILLLAIFSDYLSRAFHGEWIWPLLGFFFMPFTTLAYALGMNRNGGISGLYLVLLIVAVLMDFGAIGTGAKARRKRVVIVKRES